jgi:hypothetical protein
MSSSTGSEHSSSCDTTCRYAAPVPAGTERYWKWAALVLSVVLSAGALASGFGRAFYVTRTEYTARTQDEAVAREGMRGTLERLDKTLILQADAFKSLTGEVQGLKIATAVMQKNH